MQKYFTPQGMEKLKQELEDLKARRKVLAEKIGEALEQGDLKENAEYHAAKDEQGMNESRILEIEAIIKQAIVVEKDSNATQVQVGSTVTLKSSTGEQVFTIVGSNEADPTTGNISNESPLGKQLLNKQKGDTATLVTPKGELAFSIIDIS